MMIFPWVERYHLVKAEDEATEGSSKTNEEKSQVHKKRAAIAIERDKAVRSVKVIQ